MGAYRVVSWSHGFKGHWLVIREEDQRIMTTMPRIYEAFAWIRTWGDIIGPKKKGMELPERFECDLIKFSVT